MEKSNNAQNRSLKIIIVGLSAVILMSLFYMSKMAERPKKIIVSLRHEKAVIIKDLEKTQLLLNAVKTDNKNLEEKLIEENKKIEKFISSLKNKPLEHGDLSTYKRSIILADERIRVLLEEIVVYRKKNDSIAFVLKNEKRKNDTLKKTNSSLTKTNGKLKITNGALKSNNNKLLEKISEASSLNYYNLETKNYRIKNSKKEMETDNANKINLMKISFSIGENKLVKPSDKRFYIQIIDPKNNVVGLKEKLKFDEDLLIYSTAIALKYENENTTVSTELKVDNLEKGNYVVTIFDNSKKILQSKFVLN